MRSQEQERFSLSHPTTPIERLGTLKSQLLRRTGQSYGGPGRRLAARRVYGSSRKHHSRLAYFVCYTQRHALCEVTAICSVWCYLIPRYARLCFSLAQTKTTSCLRE